MELSCRSGVALGYQIMCSMGRMRISMVFRCIGSVMRLSLKSLAQWQVYCLGKVQVYWCSSRLLRQAQLFIKWSFAGWLTHANLLYHRIIGRNLLEQRRIFVAHWVSRMYEWFDEQVGVLGMLWTCVSQHHDELLWSARRHVANVVMDGIVSVTREKQSCSLIFCCLGEKISSIEMVVINSMRVATIMVVLAVF